MLFLYTIIFYTIYAVIFIIFKTFQTLLANKQKHLNIKLQKQGNIDRRLHAMFYWYINPFTPDDTETVYTVNNFKVNYYYYLQIKSQLHRCTFQTLNHDTVKYMVFNKLFTNYYVKVFTIFRSRVFNHNETFYKYQFIFLKYISEVFTRYTSKFFMLKRNFSFISLNYFDISNAKIKLYTHPNNRSTISRESDLFRYLRLLKEKRVINSIATSHKNFNIVLKKALATDSNMPDELARLNVVRLLLYFKKSIVKKYTDRLPTNQFSTYNDNPVLYVSNVERNIITDFLEKFTKPGNFRINFINSTLNKNIKLDTLNVFILYFLRKAKIFSKGRYSRNRQFYRTGYYWCVYLSLILFVGLYYWFYHFVLNIGYLWWLFAALLASFVVPKAIKFNLYNPEILYTSYISNISWLLQYVKFTLLTVGGYIKWLLRMFLNNTFFNNTSKYCLYANGAFRESLRIPTGLINRWTVDDIHRFRGFNYNKLHPSSNVSSAVGTEISLFQKFNNLTLKQNVTFSSPLVTAIHTFVTPHNINSESVFTNSSKHSPLNFMVGTENQQFNVIEYFNTRNFKNIIFNGPSFRSFSKITSTFLYVVMIVFVFLYFWIFISINYSALMPNFLMLDVTAVMLTFITLGYSGLLPGFSYSYEFLVGFIKSVNMFNYNYIDHTKVANTHTSFSKSENSYFTGKSYGDSWVSGYYSRINDILQTQHISKDDVSLPQSLSNVGVINFAKDNDVLNQPAVNLSTYSSTNVDTILTDLANVGYATSVSTASDVSNENLQFILWNKVLMNKLVIENTFTTFSGNDWVYFTLLPETYQSIILKFKGIVEWITFDAIVLNSNNIYSNLVGISEFNDYSEIKFKKITS